jgi:hypothetical protein
VDENSVVIADLIYAIADFKDGSYSILVQFETNDPLKTNAGDSPKQYYELNSASGQYQIEFPLKYVWNRPDIKRPLHMWFFLTRLIPQSNQANIVAAAGPVMFQTK